MFNTPILFLIFNRPDVTQQVFDIIKQIKPKYLYVAADGPRENKDGEAEKCNKTREIINQIDWECELKTLFRDDNLGCKKGVSSAIDWFFENVEEGIILEDDCLPSLSFFKYCENLLKHYRNDTRVMHISGTNQLDEPIDKYSYYFDVYTQIWGWATWKRAWKYYDINMTSYPDFKSENKIKDIYGDYYQQLFWTKNLDEAIYGNTWDNMWFYAVFSQGGLCINPNKNLVSNIGFGADAVHTGDEDSEFANRKRYDIDEIIHPRFVLKNTNASNMVMQKMRKNELKQIEFDSKTKIEKEVIRFKRKILKNKELV